MYLQKLISLLLITGALSGQKWNVESRSGRTKKELLYVSGALKPEYGFRPVSFQTAPAACWLPFNGHEVSTLLLRRGFQVGGVRTGRLCNRFFPVQLCLSLSLGGKTYVRLLFAWHQEPARQ